MLNLYRVSSFDDPGNRYALSHIHASDGKKAREDKQKERDKEKE